MPDFNEELFQFIWQHKLLKPLPLISTVGNAISILKPGELNLDSGPDFFNAQIKINELVLAGNVEIHIKTSDWLKHKHERDRNYDTIILHVVYEHDLDLEQNKKHNVEVLEIKHLVDQKTLDTYHHLLGTKEKLACGKQLKHVEGLKFISWLERMTLERLETKVNRIEDLFSLCEGDYTQTFFILLLRNFGFKVNALPFELLAKQLPVHLLLKHRDNLPQLEALLLGMSGLLEDQFEDAYIRSLQNEFEFLKNKYSLPPLKIRGKKLKGGEVEIDGSISSQFVSALLLIAPVLEKGLIVHQTGKGVSRPYIDMTVSLLKDFGIEVQESSQGFTVLPSSVSAAPSVVTVESDWSSASYWYSVCALSPNSTLELRSFSKASMQADSVLPQIFRDLGVETVFKGASVMLTHTKPLVKTFSYDFTDCPDIAQTLAVTCYALGIKAELNGLSTLKVKETDRLLALKQELEKCGAEVSITPDSIHIKPRTASHTSLTPQIHTYNDHRMAMSFAPLSLLFGKLKIDAPEVVNKSYPAFWEDLKSLGFNVNLQP